MRSAFDGWRVAGRRVLYGNLISRAKRPDLCSPSTELRPGILDVFHTRGVHNSLNLRHLTGTFRLCKRGLFVILANYGHVRRAKCGEIAHRAQLERPPDVGRW